MQKVLIILRTMSIIQFGFRTHEFSFNLEIQSFAARKFCHVQNIYVIVIGLPVEECIELSFSSRRRIKYVAQIHGKTDKK